MNTMSMCVPGISVHKGFHSTKAISGVYYVGITDATTFCWMIMLFPDSAFVRESTRLWIVRNLLRIRNFSYISILIYIIVMYLLVLIYLCMCVCLHVFMGKHIYVLPQPYRNNLLFHYVILRNPQSNLPESHSPRWASFHHHPQRA